MPSLNEEHLIALLHLPGIGPRTAFAVAEFTQKHPESDDDLVAIARRARVAGIKVPEIDQSDLDEALREARNSIHKISEQGGTILSFFNQHYPTLLRTIPQPPLLLFVLGDYRVLTERPTVAVIGTREPSHYGIRWGRRIAQVLGEAGFTIVSGLAEGSDTAAHLGALDVKAPTVAFLAHGFGRIYPKSNQELADRIVEDGGCLVTEYLPGAPPRRSSFVERDRLQSGCSRGIVVVETDVEGGTMHTVGFARVQRRIIAALSHPQTLIGTPKSRGNQELISSGEALPVASKEDVAILIAKLCAFQGSMTLNTTVRQRVAGDQEFSLNFGD